MSRADATMYHVFTRSFCVLFSSRDNFTTTERLKNVRGTAEEQHMCRRSQSGHAARQRPPAGIESTLIGVDFFRPEPDMSRPLTHEQFEPFQDADFTVDVAVVGAGVSGAYSAWRLKQE